MTLKRLLQYIKEDKINIICVHEHTTYTDLSPHICFCHFKYLLKCKVEQIYIDNNVLTIQIF